MYIGEIINIHNSVAAHENPIDLVIILFYNCIMDRIEAKSFEVEIHQHAIERMVERGITSDEIIETIGLGETYPAKFERTAFERDFEYNSKWMGKKYKIKQVEVIVVKEENKYVVVTVISRYF